MTGTAPLLNFLWQYTNCNEIGSKATDYVVCGQKNIKLVPWVNRIQKVSFNAD